jgi:prepilin-type N-terminal cleavage/methylation domain-containing protein
MHAASGRQAERRAKSGQQAERAARRSRAKSRGPERAARRSRAKSRGPERAARRSRADSTRQAFTLIELLAVLLIMGLVAGITLPNLSLGSERAVLGAAQALAADLSFTRQRAVATGATHRVVVDLDAAGWWIEEWAEEASAFAPAPESAPGERREIQLAAPRAGLQEFQPLAGPFGRPHALPDGVAFASVETLAAGAVLAGQVELVFEGDGTADPALFALVNEDGDVVHLELSRLADRIRIQRGE